VRSIPSLNIWWVRWIAKYCCCLDSHKYAIYREPNHPTIRLLGCRDGVAPSSATYSWAEHNTTPFPDRLMALIAERITWRTLRPGRAPIPQVPDSVSRGGFSFRLLKFGSLESIAKMDPYGSPYPPEQENYMAQEDEWEREGLLDPEWEKQQRKVSNFIQTGLCRSVPREKSWHRLFCFTSVPCPVID